LVFYFIPKDIRINQTKTLQGMVVNEETLATEVIKAVGPVGNFLGQKHTRTYMKRELSTSSLFDRRMYDVWQRDGEKDLYRRAREKAPSIFKNQKADPVALKSPQNSEASSRRQKSEPTRISRIQRF